jgi:hypothetical protein
VGNVLKNNCKIKMRIVLVCPLYLIKYGSIVVYKAVKFYQMCPCPAPVFSPKAKGVIWRPGVNVIKLFPAAIKMFVIS